MRRYYSPQETDARPDDYERAVVTRPMRATAPVVAIAPDATQTDNTEGEAA